MGTSMEALLRFILQMTIARPVATLYLPGEDRTSMSRRGETMIVVADDDRAVTQLVSQVLHQAGYLVMPAYTGEEAYRYIKRPDCVGLILDLRMPEISGAELLMLMASEGINLPVIVIAGFPDFDEDELRQFPNVRRFFHRPFLPEDILAAVRDVMPPPSGGISGGSNQPCLY